jgi:hypothetical protein
MIVSPFHKKASRKCLAWQRVAQYTNIRCLSRYSMTSHSSCRTIVKKQQKSAVTGALTVPADFGFPF